jgi:hypothetical protein
LEFGGNRLQVGVRVARTDHEEIGEIGNAAQVEDCDVLRFLVCGDAGDGDG